jgi:phage terminase large subunit GpA-like protein
MTAARIIAIGIVPEGGLFLTAGVDVQKDRLGGGNRRMGPRT